jgi:hypothetical protein
MDKYLKTIRDNTGKTQAEIGVMLWPELDPTRARNRVAKYETGTIPPGDTLLKYQEIEKLSKGRPEGQE